MVGHRACDEVPETWGVIELAQVAELVHDNVVGKLGRQKYDLVIEIQVPLFRTTAPTRLVILDEHFA